MGATHFSGLNVGGSTYDGTDITKIKSATVAINPGSVAAQASLEVAVTVTGAATGDIVIFEPPASLETGLAVACVGRVSAADTVQLRLTNVTGIAIDGAELTWRYLWIDLT